MKKTVTFILFCLMAGPLCGYWDDYGPFAPGREPRRWKLERIEPSLSDDEGGVTRFGEKSGIELTLKRRDATDGVTMSVQLERSGEVLLTETDVSDFYYFPSEAWISDLNGDGRTDFTFALPSGGNGLASQISQRVIVYSSPSGYQVDSRWSFNADVNDFLDLGDGSATVVWTSFIYGEEGRDGKVHNYWVYRLQGFVRGELGEVNGRIGGFPRWIMYTFGPNHRPTRQLTEGQKERLWRESMRPGGENSPHRQQ
jgi:hypothetical protein